MQNTPRERLLQLSPIFQTDLFDRLETELGPLSEKGRLLIAVLAMVPPARWIAPETMFAALPRHCSLAVKKSSKGHLRY